MWLTADSSMAITGFPILFVVFLLPALSSQQSCSARTDIVMVIDGSDSMTSEQFSRVRNASATFARGAFDRLSNVKLGAVIYGAAARIFLPLSSNIDDVETALFSVNKTLDNATATDLGIRTGVQVYTDAFYALVMVVITDGISSNPSATRSAANFAKLIDVNTFSVGISYNLLQSGAQQTELAEFTAEITDIALESRQAVVVDNFDTLTQNVSAFLDILCVAPAWSPWSSSVGDCSVSCGGGTRSRTYRRTCSVLLSPNSCPGPSIRSETEVCGTQACIEWNQWTSSVGDCSVTCGGGTRLRTFQRSCNDTSVPNACTGDNSKSETELCSTQACPVCSARTDIVMVIDGSDSMTSEQFSKVRNASATFAREAFNRMANVKIGAVIYGAAARTFLPLSSNVDAIERSLLSINKTLDNATSTDLGIRTGVQMLTDTSSARVMLVITDGLSRVPRTTRSAANFAKITGAEIFSVGITYNLRQSGALQTVIDQFIAEIRGIALGLERAVVVDTFDTLTQNVSALLDKICIPTAATWGEWTSSVGDCSVSCGGGTLLRTFQRTCSDTETPDACPGASNRSETEVCGTETCPAWSQWTSSTGDCSATCGGGTLVRTYQRTCSDTSTPDACAGSNTRNETEECGTQTCPAVWSEWTESGRSPCSAPCNGGMQTVTRSRSCLSQTCKENSTESFPTECNLDPCTLRSPLMNTEAQEGSTFQLDVVLAQSGVPRGQWTKDGVPIALGTRFTSEVNGNTHTLRVMNSVLADQGTYMLTVGGVSTSANVTVTSGTAWSQWTSSTGDCSATCGGGTLVRTYQRTCSDTSTPDACAGANTRSETEECGTQACPAWSQWSSSVGGCSVTCGGGTQLRTFQRSCSDTSAPNSCPGANTRSETLACNTQICPAWSQWTGSIGDCSATCGGGTLVRTYQRTCSDTSTPDACAGSNTRNETEECGTQTCPAWSQWTSTAGECSATCGEGTLLRTYQRKCSDNSTPSACPGNNSKSETEICSIQTCPEAGVDTTKLVVGIGVTLALLVLIAAAVVLILYTRHKRQQMKYEMSMGNHPNSRRSGPEFIKLS